MSWQEIDFLFPFMVFFYGALMCAVFYNPFLMKLAEERVPHQVLQQFKSHRALAGFCLVLGSLWSLQNLWLG